MNEKLSVSETLNKAADLIEERGWVKDGDGWAWDKPASPLCLEGAIFAAHSPEVTEFWHSQHINECPAGNAVRGYLNMNGELWQWNDRGLRTATEVIEVLRATAVIEAAREDDTIAAEFVALMASPA